MFYMILIGLALMERLAFDLGPNIELVTMASVMVGMYGQGKWRWLVPVIIMMLSDVVLGWGWITIFTWSGFVLMTFLPIVLTRVKNNMLKGLASGLAGVLLFYVWTNFGVWVTDQWGMYARNLSGLMQCYINGLPFLRLQMVGMLLTLPLGIYIYETVVNIARVDEPLKLVNNNRKNDI